MTNYPFPHEKLEVWHEAKDLVKQVYAVTKDFPSTELYGLTSQINRAAVSVMSNIAEGSARTSRKDQAHFSQLAYSSLMEVVCQLQLAYELNLFEREEFEKIHAKICGLSVRLNALRRSQLKSIEL